MNPRSAACAALLFLAAFAQATASACPLVEGLIDFNCNRKVKIVATGDSIVRGTGDKKGLGGYVGRLDSFFGQAVEVSNVGVPGTNAGRLYRQFQRNIGHGITRRLTRAADVVFIDVGRNSFFLENTSPTKEVRNIKRLAKFLKTKIGQHLGVEPFVVIATLIPTNRGFQRGFIDSINDTLLRKNSAKFPVLLRFDELPNSILSSDGLHPSAKGYNRIASYTLDFVLGPLQQQLEKRVSDADQDGIYDKIETLRYGSNPALADTDGDGLIDGDEVFTYGTDVTTADTDGDGFSDGDEIVSGTDPFTPNV